LRKKKHDASIVFFCVTACVCLYLVLVAALDFFAIYVPTKTLTQVINIVWCSPYCPRLYVYHGSNDLAGLPWRALRKAPEHLGGYDDSFCFGTGGLLSGLFSIRYVCGKDIKSTERKIEKSILTCGDTFFCFLRRNEDKASVGI